MGAWQSPTDEVAGAGLVLPDYGNRCLSSLLPSIEAILGGGEPVLPLPRASKYVVLLVDGLGYSLLEDYAEHAEWMASALPAATALTCAIPSTTATSLTTLGTGVAPGEHGIVGYSFLDPDRDRILNALTWEGGPEDVEEFRRVGTCYSRLACAGHPCAAVSLARFENSALQQLAFRGTTHYGLHREGDVEDVTAALHAALEHHDVIYCYERMLDHIGHSSGAGSWKWLDMLGYIDDLIQHMVASLPGDVALVVTGDHGMVNVPQEHRIVIEEVPALDGWRVVGGEGRFRQIYTDAPVSLAARWAEYLDDRALVRTREQGIAEGWFGPVVRPDVIERIGDVVVALRGDWALMSTTFPNEFSLVGMHGSLTPQEMVVPLLTHGG